MGEIKKPILVKKSLHRRLKDRAKTEKRSIGAVVEIIVEKYLGVEQS